MSNYVDVSKVPMSIAFHGGEPTLIGVKRFRELVTWAKDALGDKLRGVALQTNATLIDRDWAQAVLELGIAPSISIDGPKNIHDAARVDLLGKGSHDQVVRGIREIQAIGIAPNVLCVINPEHSGYDVYRHLRELGVTRMDFLLPDISHDNFGKVYGHLGRTPVADYLLPILDAWIEEDNEDVRVRIFYELFKKLMGGHGETDAFSTLGTSYLIVETDGSIEAMDALRVCENGMSQTGMNVLTDELTSFIQASPVARDVIQGRIPLAGKCQSCEKLRSCGGGYLPSRYSKENMFANPSVWCADLKKLTDAMQCFLDFDQPLPTPTKYASTGVSL